MKRYLVILVTLLMASLLVAQKTFKPTSSFTIMGEVKTPATVGAAELKKLTEVAIGDVVITNHLGEKKSDATGLKGVLLRDVLGTVELNAESPKVLSEYYFVCKANDGYKVVYSWNELFNTDTGNSAFLITEKAGKALSNMDDSILMISKNDKATGRRYVKSLESIEVKRAR